MTFKENSPMLVQHLPKHSAYIANCSWEPSVSTTSGSTPRMEIGEAPRNRLATSAVAAAKAAWQKSIKKSAYLLLMGLWDGAQFLRGQIQYTVVLQNLTLHLLSGNILESRT